MVPECIGYDENVPDDRSSRSEATRFSGRMFHILAVNPAWVKARRAGFFEGDPVFCVVADGLLGVPLEHPIMYILNSNEDAICYRRERMPLRAENEEWFYWFCGQEKVSGTIVRHHCVAIYGMLQNSCPLIRFRSVHRPTFSP